MTPLVMKQNWCTKMFSWRKVFVFFYWMMSTESYYGFFFSCSMNRETDVSLTAALLPHSYILFFAKGKKYKEVWSTSQVYFLSDRGCVWTFPEVDFINILLLKKDIQERNYQNILVTIRFLVLFQFNLSLHLFI